MYSTSADYYDLFKKTSLSWYLAAAAASFLCVYAYRRRHFYRFNSAVTNPPSWPFVGAARVIHFGEMFNDFNFYHAKFRESKERLFAAFFGQFYIVYPLAAHNVRYVLTKLLAKAEVARVTSRLFRDGVLGAACVDKWRADRQMLEPSFRQSALKSYITTFFDESNILVRRLEPLMQTKESFHPAALLNRCTFNIVVRSTLGHNPNAPECGNQLVTKAFADLHHPVTKAVEDLHHPVTKAVEDLHHPVTKAVEDLHHPVTKAVEDLHHPVTKAVEDLHHPVTKAVEDLHHPVTKAVEDLHHPVTKAVEDLHHPVTKAFEDLHHPVTKAVEDLHHPVTKAVEDLHHPVTKAVEDLHHPVTKAVEDLHHPVTKAFEDLHHPVTKAVEDLHHPVTKAVEDLLESFQLRIMHPLLMNDTVSSLLGYKSKEERQEKILRDFARTMVRQTAKGETPDSFVARMIRSGVPEEDIVTQVVNVLFAGTDTTTTANCAVLLMLALHPDEQDKVYEEVTSILGEDETVQPSYANLQEMSYLEMVIKESLRLFPPVPLVGRHVSAKGHYLEGSELPVGADTLVYLNTLHRDPAYFPNPLVFDPSRFVPDEARKRPIGSYVPFLIGPRDCVGRRYALLQMKTILSTVLRHCRVLPAPGCLAVEDVVVEMKITSKFADQCRIRVEPRG